MSSKPRTFKQKDLERALKAAAAVGINVERVEIDKQGNIVLVIAGAKKTLLPGDDWDKALLT